MPEAFTCNEAHQQKVRSQSSFSSLTKTVVDRCSRGSPPCIICERGVGVDVRVPQGWLALQHQRQGTFYPDGACLMSVVLLSARPKQRLVGAVGGRPGDKHMVIRESTQLSSYSSWAPLPIDYLVQRNPKTYPTTTVGMLARAR